MALTGEGPLSAVSNDDVKAVEYVKTDGPSGDTALDEMLTRATYPDLIELTTGDAVRRAIDGHGHWYEIVLGAMREIERRNEDGGEILQDFSTFFGPLTEATELDQAAIDAARDRLLREGAIKEIGPARFVDPMLR